MNNKVKKLKGIIKEVKLIGKVNNEKIYLVHTKKKKHKKRKSDSKMEITELESTDKNYIVFNVQDDQFKYGFGVSISKTGKISFNEEAEEIPLKLLKKVVLVLEIKAKKKWGTEWGS